MPMIRPNLTLRLFLRLLPVLALAAALPWTFAYWIDRGWILAVLSVLFLLALMWWSLRRALSPLRALFRALSGSVNTYRDGEFNFGVHWHSNDELGELVRAHGELGDVLRGQRHELVQRELLLDTMVQNTPVAMLLSAEGGDGVRRVVYANLAARKLLHHGRKLEGQRMSELLEALPVELREAVARGGDSLFAVPVEGDEEDTYHLSRRHFSLNGRRHELLLIRLLTPELRRQEVQTWKKVIRVISHELNNSLAPIASLAHSGAELLRRGQHERVPAALATIEDRARHLEGFIRDYARFAKLPAPRSTPVEWSRFFSQLRTQVEFVPDVQPDDGIGRFDVAQMEQALLNLLKNAHESGTPADEVRASVRRTPEGWRIDVLDRGSGMNDAVLANALLPFYSTKRHGTGLGLALAREIAEAHGGRIALLNRDGGGLCVSMVLPA